MLKRSEAAKNIYQFSSLHDFASLRAEIQSKLTVLAPQEALLFFMSINEAVNNAIFHGNKTDANKKVVFTLMLLEKEIRAIICDEGEGFSCAEAHCGDLLADESGRGLAFIQYGADSCYYNTKGNEVTLIKKYKLQSA